MLDLRKSSQKWGRPGNTYQNEVAVGRLSVFKSCVALSSLFTSELIGEIAVCCHLGRKVL